MGICAAIALQGIGVDINDAIKLLVFPVLVAVLISVIPRFVKTPGERRKDVRDELKDVWNRLDSRDEEVDELRQRLRDREKESIERDSRIKELEHHVKELDYYKQRFSAVSLENDDLRRRVASLEKQIIALQKDTHKE